MNPDPNQPNPPAPQPDPEGRSLRDFFARNKLQLLPLATALLGIVLGYLLPPERVKEVEKAVEVLVPFLDDFDPPQGWKNDPAEVARVAQGMPTKLFATTPAGLVAEGELPKFVYLWKLEEKLTGKPTPLFDQNPTGSCVAHGTNRAIERTLAAEIAARKGGAEEFTHFAEEVTYAGSRVEINGGRVPFRGDGSLNAWAAKFVTSAQYGAVPKAKHGQYDLTTYDPTRCRSWGNTGVPDDLEEVARKFPVKDATRITNWADAKRALANGNGIAVASGQGFSAQRDARGVAQPRGSWAHSMCLDGYHTDENGAEWGHIENSWSNLPDQNGNRTGQPYHKGPTGWGNPTTAGFWADARVIDRMLREGDSWAYSGATGFPRKALPLDWFVRAEPAAEPKPLWKLRHDLARDDRFALAP